MDGVGGPAYIGTGCFHRREVLCGRSFTEEYNSTSKTGTTQGSQQQNLNNTSTRSKSKPGL
jgi:hypothetical protein